MLRNALAVFLGGCLGTASRLGLDALLPHAIDAFPLATLLINVLGSFTLGALTSTLWPVAPEWLRFGLGPGVLGSFTTFSAIAVSVVALAEAERLALAAVYLGATLLLGFAAAALGLALGPALGRATGRGAAR